MTKDAANTDAPDLPDLLATAVRRAGAQRRPIAAAELRGVLAQADPEADFEAVMAAALAANPDMAALSGAGGETFYRCEGAVSATYARILALRSSALELMAETIRENSRLYPRPVPLEMFELPPFDLGPATIRGCLRQMAASPEHTDIQCTASSAGTVYLYSSRHLDPGHAAMLAEHADVGVINEP